MLDQLISSLKGGVAGDLTSKIGIPADKIDDILRITGQVTTNEVTKEATSGGIGTLMNLFSGSSNNSNANSLQNNIVNGVVSQLIEKVGLDGSMAKMAATFVVPSVINKVAGKNSETPENDPSPIQNIFGLISGENSNKNTGGLMGKINDFLN